MLFAGGRSDFIEKYLESYAHWHRAGWDVTAFDWRGQGLSRGDQAPENPESFDGLVDDLAAFIADWRAEGDGPFVAVGHSMGGHLLLRALIDRSLELDAVVLVAPMLLVNSAPIPDGLAPVHPAKALAVGGLPPAEQRLRRWASGKGAGFGGHRGPGYGFESWAV